MARISVYVRMAIYTVEREALGAAQFPTFQVNFPDIYLPKIENF
jgi:hypothetical protein